MSELANMLAEGLDAMDTVSTPPWLAELHSHGRQRFVELGVPDKKVEEWKYTSLLALERRKPQLGQAQSGTEPGFQAKPLVDLPLRISMVDGALSRVDGNVPDGVQIQSLASAIEEGAPGIRAILESLLLDQQDHGFAALNTARLNAGLVVRVAENVNAGDVLLQWTGSGSKDAFFGSRLLLLLEEGASLHLLEQIENRPEDSFVLNLVVQSQLQANAQLQHTRVQQQSASSVFISRTVVTQSAGSKLHFTALDLGEGLARHDVRAVLLEKAAVCELNGACIGRGQSHADHHLEAAHVAGECESSQLFRAVAMDRSRVVFNGKVHVFDGADGTEARQSSAGLLLSKLAEIDAKPELEIYADEVIASHGATVGQLDDEAMFYLQSRGLDKSEARQLLTMAFCRSVTDRFDELSLREALGERLSQALESGVKNV